MAATPAIQSGYESPDHGKTAFGGQAKISMPKYVPLQIEPRPSGKTRRVTPPRPPQG